MQQQVADAVAERVVDDLEAIEIEEQDGEFRFAVERPPAAERCRLI